MSEIMTTEASVNGTTATDSTLAETKQEVPLADQLYEAFTAANNADGDINEIATEWEMKPSEVKRVAAEWKRDHPVSTLEDVVIGDLLQDYGTQMRPKLSAERVGELTEIYAEGLHDVEPILVYRTKDGLLLVDGWHRVAAATAAGLPVLKANVVEGTTRDAIWKAVGVNATGSMPRDAATKRKAIETLLGDDKWRKLTTRAIAKATNTSIGLVHKIKVQWEADNKPEAVLPAAAVEAEAQAQETPEEAAERVEAENAEKAKAAKRTEAELAKARAEQGRADKEFLESCGNVRSQLSPKCRKTFDADALAWRDIHTSDTFLQHKKTINLTIKDSKPGDQGPLMRFESKYKRIKHPMDWKACGACGGKGEIKKEGKATPCKNCGNGDGYVIG